MNDTILVIDEGTSSTRAMLVDGKGRVGTMAQRELVTSYPRPGWVEQDAEEIWRLTLEAAREAIGEDVARIAGIGITNQRETIVFWDRATGAALAPAVVWQDRRTADHCTALRDAGHEPALQATTGLLLDPYFSATKIAWALAHWPALRDAGDRLCVGTVESWLVFKLTGGLHVSDATNASRTQLRICVGRGTTGYATCSVCRASPCPRLSIAPGRSASPCPNISAFRSRSPAWRATSRRRRSARPASRAATPRRPMAPVPSS